MNFVPFQSLQVLAVIAFLILRAPLSHAQQTGAIFRVGHLSGSSEAGTMDRVKAFREGMRALGYIEGQKFVLEERYADGKFERLPALAQELVQRKPDVLLVSTTPGIVAAKAATSAIPMVFVGVADPIGAGIVSNLARPGGNITGITNIVAELSGKRLELLKEMVPKTTRIAVIVNPDDPNASLQMKNAEAATLGLGIRLGPVLAVRSARDLPGAFAEAARAKASGIIRMVDPVGTILRNETPVLAAKYRMPVIYAFREDVEAGGLIAYGTNLPEQYRQTATLVDKILRGAKPGELPVEQPTKFDLVINAKTARSLGLGIPPGLKVAAQIIE